MKTYKEKTTTYVPKEIEVDIWETADGRKFRNENEATKHEEYLNKMNAIRDKYKCRDIDTSDYGISVSSMGWETSARMMYIETLDDETISDLKVLYPYLKDHLLSLKDIKPGWNVFVESEYDSNSCSRWGGYDLSIYNVDVILEQKIKQLERLKEL